MKKLFIISFILCVTVFSYAQEITTVWPYLYPEFENSTIYYKSGNKFEAPVNIHLLKSKLHYLDGDAIKEVTSTDILLVMIGDDQFFDVGGAMMKIIYSDERAFLGEMVTGDYDKLKAKGGAYGGNTNSQATRSVSSLEGGYGAPTSHMDIKMRKEDGELLPLKTSHFIVVTGEIYPATKKGVEEKLSAEQKKEFGNFVKREKIRWKNTDSLIKVLIYLESI